jgi:predicted GH43/DUF377 family glycosyl hydrolase
MKHSNQVKSFTIFLFLAIISAWNAIPTFAQTDWDRLDNPVLYVGSQGEWDDETVREPAVIFDGTTYHCWYTGQKDTTVYQIGIGYASSTDGITWTKHTKPVMGVGPDGDFDDSSVQSSSVIKVGDTLKMWYQGWAGGYLENRIGYGTSLDGINWDKYPGNPVLDKGENGSWNSFGVFSPSVIFDGVTYHMWYGGVAPGDQPWEIGYATSSDGITWTEYADNPVLHAGSAGSWEEGVGQPCVFFDGTRFHMWYTGLDSEYIGRIFYATSQDGINWTKAENLNPVLDLIPGGWEQDGIETGSVLFDQVNQTCTMWYSGLKENTWQIGYATSPCLGIQGKMTNSNLPIEFTLEQNYPNPFNPSTMINYQLTMTNEVELSIYNLLGERVTTLVNGRKRAGYHQVDWDASNMASGVYLYRLEAEGYVETKKMILMR